MTTLLIASAAGALPIVFMVVVLAWLNGWDRGHTTGFREGFRAGIDQVATGGQEQREEADR